MIECHTKFFKMFLPKVMLTYVLIWNQNEGYTRTRLNHVSLKSLKICGIASIESQISITFKIFFDEFQ